MYDSNLYIQLQHLQETTVVSNLLPRLSSTEEIYH